MAKISFALNAAEEIVHPYEADREAPRGSYFCPDPSCGGEVIASKWRNKHSWQCFKHLPQRGTKNCTLSRIRAGGQQYHDAAVCLLQRYLDVALHQHKNWPVLEIATEHGLQKILWSIIGERAVREWTCPLSGRRANIAILDKNGDPVVLIEVYHSHKVDQNKALDYAGYKWIEVEAKSIMNNLPFLRVSNHGNQPSYFAMSESQRRLF